MSDLTPFATEDNIVLGRPLTDAEKEIAAELCTRASLDLRLRVPGIDALVAGDPIRKEKARVAVATAVERVLRNPEAAKQITQSAGIYSHTATLADEVASGKLYFTAADLFGLAPQATATVPTTVRVRSGYPAPHPHHRPRGYRR